MTKQSDEKNI